MRQGVAAAAGTNSSEFDHCALGGWVPCFPGCVVAFSLFERKADVLAPLCACLVHPSRSPTASLPCLLQTSRATPRRRSSCCDGAERHRWEQQARAARQLWWQQRTVD
jgi:hypothetical protein